MQDLIYEVELMAILLPILQNVPNFVENKQKYDEFDENHGFCSFLGFKMTKIECFVRNITKYSPF